MVEEQSDDLELDGPITLRILDGIAWDFAQAKWWRWWKTVRCGSLILSYCPRNPHGKAGNEERRRRRLCILWFSIEKQLTYKYAQNLNRFWRHRKYDAIFRRYGLGVTTMTSSTQSQLFWKIWWTPTAMSNLVFPWFLVQTIGTTKLWQLRY